MLGWIDGGAWHMLGVSDPTLQCVPQSVVLSSITRPQNVHGGLFQQQRPGMASAGH